MINKSSAVRRKRSKRFFKPLTTVKRFIDKIKKNPPVRSVLHREFDRPMPSSVDRRRRRRRLRGKVVSPAIARGGADNGR